MKKTDVFDVEEIQKPTQGRIVMYYPGAGDPIQKASGAPCTAIVSDVSEDGVTVTLHVLNTTEDRHPVVVRTEVAHINNRSEGQEVLGHWDWPARK